MKEIPKCQRSASRPDEVTASHEALRNYLFGRWESARRNKTLIYTQTDSRPLKGPMKGKDSTKERSTKIKERVTEIDRQDAADPTWKREVMGPVKCRKHFSKTMFIALHISITNLKASVESKKLKKGAFAVIPNDTAKYY